jgi:hypothetical protein
MKISYRFTFANGVQKDFVIHLDAETLSIIPSVDHARPEWTRLSHHRCQGCRFEENAVRYCPIAVNISDAINFFRSCSSHDRVEVLVATEERFYGKKTTVQRALGSLLGVYMAASGCPSMEKLKPMVRFHLPIATVEETVFRSAATYLVGQYFLRKQGKRSDLDLVELADMYKGIQKVNRGIWERIQGVVAKDAANNAVICLDMFAKELPYAIEDKLEELEKLFGAYG